jgi:hypothetical protein
MKVLKSLYIIRGNSLFIHQLMIILIMVINIFYLLNQFFCLQRLDPIYRSSLNLLLKISSS